MIEPSPRRNKLGILYKIDLILIKAFQERWQKKIPPNSSVYYVGYPEITGRTIRGKGIYGIGYFNKWFEVKLDDPELASKTGGLLIQEGSETGTWDLNKTRLVNFTKRKSVALEAPKQTSSIEEDHVPVYIQKQRRKPT